MVATGMETSGAASTGFLYDGGSVPVCCTPEFLAAYGVGLDSTYGDGIVEGVLREDQAESAFMGMFPDEYGAIASVGEELNTLTDDIKTFALSLPEGTNLFNLTKALESSNEGDENALNNLNDEQKELLPTLQGIVDSVDALVAANPELEGMLTNFFGQDTLDGEGSIGHMMVSTVLLGYDVENEKEGGNGADGRDNITMDQADLDQLGAGEQPRVSLGEIVQWSMETHAFMGMYNQIGGGDSLADFTQKLFTLVSDGSTEELAALGATATPPYSAEQLQVLASVMMNNHSNLMNTTGNYANSGKNGAHEYLNNVTDTDGNNNNRAFNMLHIGNLGSSKDMDDETGELEDEDGDAEQADGGASNENLNNVVTEMTREDGNGAGAIFYAGDNGQGANGGFNDLTADEGYLAGYGTGITPTNDPTADAVLANEGAKTELLSTLSAAGAGEINTETAPQEVTIGGEVYNASIENSEDFENEGYDVVIINLTDTDGNLVGSMTATEAMDETGTPQLVEYADKNGDGIVDDVDFATGESKETFDPNGISVLTYHDQDSEAGSGMVDWEATGGPETHGGLSMNEEMDPTTGQWQPMAGFGEAFDYMTADETYEGPGGIFGEGGGVASSGLDGYATKATDADGEYIIVEAPDLDPTSDLGIAMAELQDQDIEPVLYQGMGTNLVMNDIEYTADGEEIPNTGSGDMGYGTMGYGAIAQDDDGNDMLFTGDFGIFTGSTLGAEIDGVVDPLIYVGENNPYVYEGTEYDSLYEPVEDTTGGTDPVVDEEEVTFTEQDDGTYLGSDGNSYDLIDGEYELIQ